MPVATFRFSKVNSFPCVVCGKSFEKRKYLQDDIKSVHIKSLKCDFCDYCVAPRRRKRLADHLRKKRNFPILIVTPVLEHPLPPLSTPETDMIRLVEEADVVAETAGKETLSKCSLVNAPWSCSPVQTLPSEPCPVPLNSPVPDPVSG